MDEFKIALFEREYNTAFPKYETLGLDECDNLLISVANRYNISLESFETDLAKKESFFDGDNCLESFELINTLRNLGVEPMRTIFVNWHRFEKVDAFSIADLNKYFYDIWFPGSDDIDLLDESLDWVLSIRHDGCMSFIAQYSA